MRQDLTEPGAAMVPVLETSARARIGDVAADVAADDPPIGSPTPQELTSLLVMAALSGEAGPVGATSLIAPAGAVAIEGVTRPVAPEADPARPGWVVVLSVDFDEGGPVDRREEEAVQSEAIDDEATEAVTTPVIPMADRRVRRSADARVHSCRYLP